MDLGDIARRIGVGVVMIVPTFVGGGAVWAMIHSWIAVFIWILIMAALTGYVVGVKLAEA